VPEHIWRGVKDPLHWTGNTLPVGTGPFLLEKGSFTQYSFRLKRNPEYWQIGNDGQPLPYIGGIQYISASSKQHPTVCRFNISGVLKY
jgi:peptide/nickel transport system substrate-binding protein